MPKDVVMNTLLMSLHFSVYICVGLYHHTLYIFTHTFILHSAWMYPCPTSGFRRMEITTSPCSFLPLKNKKQNYLILILLYRQRKMLIDWVTASPITMLPTGVTASPWPDCLSTAWITLIHGNHSHIQELVARMKSNVLFVFDDSAWYCTGFFPLQCAPKTFFNSWNNGYIFILERGTVSNKICDL